MTDNTQPETREFTMSQYASKDDMIAAMHARIAEMETQLEAIGAGGVSGPLMGQSQAMPDLSQLTERGAQAWAGVDAQVLRKGFSAADMATASAQGFRDGAASVAANAGSEPVAWEATVPGYIKYVTQSRYERFSAIAKSGYKPFKCSNCTTPQPTQAADSVGRDAAFEAVRKRLCAMQRYSFVLDDDGVVRRVQDRTGNWIEFDDAHALLDPVAVDAAVDADRAARAQADSQPAAAFEVADAMADSQYLAGVSAGWNAANADDPNAELQKLHESRAGYLKPLLAARAPADSVTAPAYSIDADPQGIRAQVAETITGALAFGAHGANPPPPGHWLAPFWESARWEAIRAKPIHPSADTLYLLRRLLSNQHTLTGSEFRAELGKIVEDAHAIAPLAQAADSVLEDAARWRFAEQNITYADLRGGGYINTIGFREEVSKEAVRRVIDAARKQGGAT